MWHLWHLSESVCSLKFIVLNAFSKRKENLFVNHTIISNLLVFNFFFYSSNFKIFCNLYNPSFNFCFILYDFVTFGACFRDPGPAGKFDPGGL